MEPADHDTDSSGPETEADLAVPLDQVPAARLPEIWARHAATAHDRDLNELLLELSGDSNRRLMIFPDQDPRVKRRVEDEERARLERVALQRRMDTLLEQIVERQRVIEKQQKEIEGRALTLRDGRRVFIDGDGFRDEFGFALKGGDAREAEELRKLHPGASTWQEYEEIRRQSEENERLLQKVMQEKEGQGAPDPEKLSGFEQELQGRRESTRSALAAKPDIDPAYGAVTLDDYAGPAGGDGKTAAHDFTRAVAGLTETGPAPGPLQPSGQGLAPKART